MNWKTLLPAMALLAIITPQQAWSHNHHFSNNGMNGFSNQGQMPFHNGMTNGFANQGQIPFNNGMSTIPVQGLTPFANTGMVGGCNANNGLMGLGNVNPMLMNSMMANGMMGNGMMANGMMANGMMGNGMFNNGRHRHKRRRNILTQLLSGGGMNNYNSGYGYNGYGNNGYGNQFGGFNNGGGIRSLLNRI